MLEVWTDHDPHFAHYAAHYGAKGQEPHNIYVRFIMPVVNEWSSKRAKVPRDPPSGPRSAC